MIHCPSVEMPPENTALYGEVPTEKEPTDVKSKPVETVCGCS
jgi:hypothetical protein